MVTTSPTDPRRVLLLLGPRSSGKTTFVDALSAHTHHPTPTLFQTVPLPAYGMVIVDTPGLEEGSIVYELEEWVSTSFTDDIIIAVLYFFDIAAIPSDYAAIRSDFKHVKAFCRRRRIETIGLVSNKWNLKMTGAIDYWGEKHEEHSDTWLMGVKQFHYDGTVLVTKQIVGSLLSTDENRRDAESTVTSSNRSPTVALLLKELENNIQRGDDLADNVRVYLEYGGT